MPLRGVLKLRASASHGRSAVFTRKPRFLRPAHAKLTSESITHIPLNSKGGSYTQSILWRNPIHATSGQPCDLSIDELRLPASDTSPNHLIKHLWSKAKPFLCGNTSVAEVRQSVEKEASAVSLRLHRVGLDTLDVYQTFKLAGTSRVGTYSMQFAEVWYGPMTVSEIDAHIAEYGAQGDASDRARREVFDRFSRITSGSLQEIKHLTEQLLPDWAGLWRERTDPRGDVHITCEVSTTSAGFSVSIPSRAVGRLPTPPNGRSHRAVIALGSNVGDRVRNIEQAYQEMEAASLRVTAMSAIYETKAMYYEDQESFLNCACEVETNLDPLPLLDLLQDIERRLGRVRVVDKGPRTLDLDIILYDFDAINNERLHVPHQLMLEREFVLRPLADMIPEERLPPPNTAYSIRSHLDDVSGKSAEDRPFAVTTIGPRLPLVKSRDPSRKTHVMAILNVTPDSFSDGGQHSSTDLEALQDTVRGHIAGGASIIDVGGQSTRPKATRITAEEELERVIPVIRAIRELPEASAVSISVDTFYAQVAREAIHAGADIVNDVSGGLLDPEILPVVAELQKTIVLMHMRGTPETMTKLTQYPQGVIHGIAIELLQRVAAARAAGIPQWRIVLDPGFGFAKTHAQNLELLAKFRELRDWPGLEHFAWLIGTSRKGFVGKATGVPNAEERTWGTAATVTASVATGADIVRVHDVPEMVQVVKMADAIYRRKEAD